MRSHLIVRDATEKALAAALAAIEYHGNSYALDDSVSMLQDVISQLNGEIRSLRPERPIYVRDAR